jgi:peptidoglycan/LPS O-acetylase OafA/YrhL
VRRRALLLLIAAAASFALALQAIGDHEPALAPTGPFLVACFLAGMALFQNRDRIPISGAMAAIVAVAVLALLSIDGAMYLAALPLAYVTVCLGLTRPPATVAVRGDYSYGVYLFAYPIQQACVQLSPSLRTTGAVFLVAAPLSLAYAAFSWRCIERPILTRKRQIAASIAHRLAFATILMRRLSRKRELQTEIV